MSAVSLFSKAVFGALMGGAFGAISGFGLGFAAGTINDATLTGEALEDLHSGFADLAPSGLSFFGMLVCGIVGGIGGLVGAPVASVYRSASRGILAGGLVATMLLLASGLFTSTSGHWYETQIVFSLGSLGSAGAAVTFARFLEGRSNEPH